MINFDDEMDDRERWADDHGYSRGCCRIHGQFWTDTGDGCPNCESDFEDRDEATGEATDGRG